MMTCKVQQLLPSEFILLKSDKQRILISCYGLLQFALLGIPVLHYE